MTTIGVLCVGAARDICEWTGVLRLLNRGLDDAQEMLQTLTCGDVQRLETPTKTKFATKIHAEHPIWHRV